MQVTMICRVIFGWVIIGCVVFNATLMSARAFEFPTTGFQVLLEPMTTTSPQTDFLPVDAWVVDPAKVLPPNQSGAKIQFFAKYSQDNKDDAGVMCDHRTADKSRYCGTIAPIGVRASLLKEASSSMMMERDHTWIWQQQQQCGSTTDDAYREFEQRPPGPNEVICLEGELAQAVQGLSLVPPGLPVIWKPPATSGVGWTMVDVWKFRSLGCRGIWLMDNAIDAALFRKLKRPCSAMDYPPTIYMIGEDEIS